ncbi:hypothetical protein BJ165DRAFT_1398358 [Panaeolus papilionaceus]|nr:hypothetical protein BJ165DRAFT_1398358 [Panaeolus papilionaceus]
MLFEKFCDVEQKKFDPSRVSELYDTVKYCALHHCTFLFVIFDEHGWTLSQQPQQDRKIHKLYGRAKAHSSYTNLSITEGPHSSNVFNSTRDARHSLNVQPRRKLTQYLPYSVVIEKLSKHFDRLVKPAEAYSMIVPPPLNAVASHAGAEP